MDYLGFEIAEIFTRQLVIFFIVFLVGATLLHIATAILNFEKRSLAKAAGVVLLGSFIIALLSLIPIIGGLLGLVFFWFLIKKIYDVGWFKAIIAWFMSIVIAFIIALIILLLSGLSLFLM